MKTRSGIDYFTLHQSIVISLVTCACFAGFFFMIYLALSLVFGSWAGFLTVFSLCVGVGAYMTYDDEAHYQRVATESKRAGGYYDDDLE